MISSRSKVKLDLEVAGAASVEPVEPRLDALEARVMSSIAIVADGESAVVVPFSMRRATTARRVGIGAVAACFLALAVLAAGWFTTGDQSLVIAAADDVTIVFPDGSTSPGEAGLALPLGSEVDVGGSMVIEGVTYGPGIYKVTADGVESVSKNDGASVVVDSRTDDSASTTAPARSSPAPTTTRNDSTVVSSVPSTSEPGSSGGPVTGTSLPERDDAEANRDQTDERLDPTQPSTERTETIATTRPPQTTTTQDHPTTTAPDRTRPDQSRDSTDTTSPAGDRRGDG